MSRLIQYKSKLILYNDVATTVRALHTSSITTEGLFDIFFMQYIIFFLLLWNCLLNNG